MSIPANQRSARERAEGTVVVRRPTRDEGARTQMKRLKQKLKTLLGKEPEAPVSAGPSDEPVPDILPEPARTAARQARDRFDAGEFVAALKLVESVLDTGNAAPGWHYFHGGCLERVGRHEEALAAYEKELALQPAHRAARDRVAQLRQALARPNRSPLDTRERPYHTSLPRETLLVIQQSLHNYQYRGVPMLKNPFDLALYSRLLWQLKPRTLIEIGSKAGGSGLWFGDLFNNLNPEGHVHSIDIVKVNSVSHPRVTFLEGNGRRLEECLSEAFLRDRPRPWLIIEDADHAYETSIAVLRFFHPWLQPGDYIVIEDGIISDLSQIPDCNSGPHRALKEFLGIHADEYEIDADYCDFFGYNVTWCTNGFLRKKTRAPKPDSPAQSPSADLR